MGVHRQAAGGPSGLSGLADQSLPVGTIGPNGRNQRFEVCVPGQPRIEPFESLGRSQQQLGGLRGTALVEGNTASQLFGERLPRSSDGGSDSTAESSRSADSSAPASWFALAAAKVRLARRAPSGAQESGPLEECGSGQQTAPGLRPTGRPFEF